MSIYCSNIFTVKSVEITVKYSQNNVHAFINTSDNLVKTYDFLSHMYDLQRNKYEFLNQSCNSICCNL